MRTGAGPSPRVNPAAVLDAARARLVVVAGRTGATGLLADALCLSLHPARTFGRRLLRDLAEGRKPPLTLLRRGYGLARTERELVRSWTAAGCRPVTPREAERVLRGLTANVSSP